VCVGAAQEEGRKACHINDNHTYVNLQTSIYRVSWASESCSWKILKPQAMTHILKNTLTHTHMLTSSLMQHILTYVQHNKNNPDNSASGLSSEMYQNMQLLFQRKSEIRFKMEMENTLQ